MLVAPALLAASLALSVSGDDGALAVMCPHGSCYRPTGTVKTGMEQGEWQCYDEATGATTNAELKSTSLAELRAEASAGSTEPLEAGPKIRVRARQCSSSSAVTSLSADAKPEEKLKCSEAKSCEGCMAMAKKGCGWCGSAAECMSGHSVAPAACPANDWNFPYCKGARRPPPSPEPCAGRLTRARVADEPCLANSNCYICTQDPFCSWRFDTSECVFATNSIRASEASAKTHGGTPTTTYNGETCYLSQSNIYYLA